jgi:putative nucleotidyltransferase with HDIG domain
LDTLGALVLGHGVFKSGVATGLEGFSLERLWQHSLDVAATARAVALCEQYPKEKADEAFLGGMLHDVGKIVFATRLAAATDGAVSVQEAFAQMEACHAEVGAYLLGLWGFPNPIVAAVAFHEAPSQAVGEALALPHLIHIADRLVHQRSGDRPGAVARELEPGLLEGLGLLDRWPVWLAKLEALESQETNAATSARR